MEKLRPALGLFDAVNVALGAIIGAGIFVILGAATAISGPAVFISVIVAGAVAILTGLTSAELSRLYPTSGGAYTFAKESISDFAGFLVGWMWLFSNTVLGATVAVGFGYYLAFFFPGIPQQLAVGLVLALTTIIQLTGAKESSLLNNVLVGIKVLILLFFVGSAVFFFKPSNFEPLLPFGLGGVLAGAATIFFAYSGFARVAVIADEIKDPEKTVPRATILSITISTIIYVLVAAAAVGVAGYEVIGASKSPLASAMESESISFGSELVAGGALIATGTVLLTGILGVSRLAFTMSSNGELPRFLRDVDPRTGAPRNAIMLSGLIMLLLALFADLPHIAYISSFSLLMYYSAINLSGFRIFGPRQKAIAALGLASCLVLMFSLPIISWAVGAGVLALAVIYHRFFMRNFT